MDESLRKLTGKLPGDVEAVLARRQGANRPDQAGLDNYNEALDHLHKAANHGFDELAELRTRGTLAPRQAHADWNAIEENVRAILA